MERLKDPLLGHRTPAGLSVRRGRSGGLAALSQELVGHGASLNGGLESLDYEVRMYRCWRCM